MQAAAAETFFVATLCGAVVAAQQQQLSVHTASPVTS